MSVPARRFKWEDSVETHSMDARVSALEAHYQHIHADVQDVRDDVKGIRQEMTGLSAKFDEKLSQLTERFDTKFGDFQRTLEAMNINRVWDRVWMLLSMGALLGVMARGFKWI